jgi:23S rRNA-/tRNA-specific pseudouridylate synthase
MEGEEEEEELLDEEFADASGADMDADGLSDFNEDFDDDDDAGSGDNAETGLGTGLLGHTLSSGSLTADRTRIRNVDGTARGIRVVFPSLIWRGKGIMVVNKPADWICTAADVHKKRGQKPDPDEKVSKKGFKSLDDLMHFKFKDRERKYIHWWTQLVHDMDRQSYPNLFDEDQNYGLCHRLDRETSGALLMGLTRFSRQQMRLCFQSHYVRKLYVCLVHGRMEEQQQTIDRAIMTAGKRAQLDPRGERARTHVKVLGNFTGPRSVSDNGNQTDAYTLCTCEIAEGRMHQIRIHLSKVLERPIVSEMFYLNTRQSTEDRRWCERVFLHAYAVGFPDVTDGSRRADDADANKEEEFHCCICPLTEELREALQELEPTDERSTDLLKMMIGSGLMSNGHHTIHTVGAKARKAEVDDIFFPWASVINPLAKLSERDKSRGLASQFRRRTDPYQFAPTPAKRQRPLAAPVRGARDGDLRAQSKSKPTSGTRKPIPRARNQWPQRSRSPHLATRGALSRPSPPPPPWRKAAP